MKKFSNRCNY